MSDSNYTNGLSAKTLFDSIPDAVEAFKKGEFIVVLDNMDRENEGDLIIAAEHFTPAKCAFMVRHSSGYVCAPITAQRAAKLELPQMVTNNADPNRTAYTITIDADEGTTTGISAVDRSLTCRKLADPSSTISTFRRPGHVVPLQARNGGTRVRPGHTEAAVDFCYLAGLQQVGVIAELVEATSGEEKVSDMETATGMMNRDGCISFALKHGLKVVTIDDLVKHLTETEGAPKVY